MGSIPAEVAPLSKTSFCPEASADPDELEEPSLPPLLSWDPEHAVVTSIRVPSAALKMAAGMGRNDIFPLGTARFAWTSRADDPEATKFEAVSTPRTARPSAETADTSG